MYVHHEWGLRPNTLRVRVKRQPERDGHPMRFGRVAATLFAGALS
jgi:hypothetical protein